MKEENEGRSMGQVIKIDGKRSIGTGSVQILSHIFSSDSGFGLGFLGLKQWPHVHVALR